MSRTIHFLTVICFLSFSAKAATIRWDGGGGDGLWSTAVNWVGDIIPTAADDVILDNSSLMVSYAVLLPPGAADVSVNTLTITPAGINNITLRLPVTNTSATAFTATGTGDAVVLNNGAVFINSSGAAAGTPVSVAGTNFFRINNGGHYIHNTPRGHTTNLVARLSTVAGTENGIFEFDIPDISSTISLSGRTYGTLILSSTTFGAPVTYSGNGASPLEIKGDLQINTGVTLSIGMSAAFIVRGDYIQSASSTFNLQNSTENNIVRLEGNVSSQGIITESVTGTGLPVLELRGVSNQDIFITGSITNSVSLRINNPAGVTLMSHLTLPYNLNLQNGKLRTSVSAMLSLADDGTITSGSSASFVEGPMKKIGDDASFTFPVGKGNIYAPISFNSPGLTITDEFQAEYFRINPQSIYGTNYESLFDHISYVEYWELSKTLGSLAVPVSVSLSVTQYSFAEVLNTTYISRFNTGDLQWKNNGTVSRVAGPPVPPNVTGIITSIPLTALGSFTLATTDPFAVNPLPVTLISFNASKTGEGYVNINWEMSNDFPAGTDFEIQRSEDGKNFRKISTVSSIFQKSFYSFTDYELFKGSVWYRIKITTIDKKPFFSRSVIITDRRNSLIVMNLTPNPIRQNGLLLIYSGNNEKADLVIFDAAGRIVKKWQEVFSAGNNSIKFGTSNFKSGVYFIYVMTGKTKVVVRFLKL